MKFKFQVSFMLSLIFSSLVGFSQSSESENLIGTWNFKIAVRIQSDRTDTFNMTRNYKELQIYSDSNFRCDRAFGKWKVSAEGIYLSKLDFDRGVDFGGKYYFIEKCTDSTLILTSHLDSKKLYSIKYIFERTETLDFESHWSVDTTLKVNPMKVTDKMSFNKTGTYKVTDIHGNVLKSGNSNFVDVIDLERGMYYLQMGNESVEFLKK